MIELGNLHTAEFQRAFIQIIGDTIVGITDQPVTNHWVDLNNNLAVPGLIDMHVHDRKGQPDKELDSTLQRAALLGGVTTIVKMPNTKVPATTAEIINDRHRDNQTPHITGRFWLGATPDNISEIISAAHNLRGIVIGVKIYMGSSTGNLLVTDPNVLRKIFQTCAEYDLVVGVHAENEAMMQQNLKRVENNFGAVVVSDHCQIRDTQVEVSAVRLALCLQKQTGCKLYFCHISTPESLELIMDAKQQGRTVFAEVCPHHLYLDQELMRGPKGGEFKMNPPLRTREQVNRLCDYLCTPGYVDGVATDHAPHKYPEEKVGQPYNRTASGVPGIQTLLPLIFNFVKNGKMSLQQFLALTSGNAAKIFNLSGHGKLEVGAKANITIINEQEFRTLRNEDMATLWKWTPFSGMVACGFPSHVVSNGVLFDLKNLT